jgi:hypothetical protein
MRLPATKFIVFNAAAALVGVAALGAAVRAVRWHPARSA